MALAVRSLVSTLNVDTCDRFELLFRAEYGRVVAIAQRVVQDPDEAEDVAQDVFVSFHRSQAADAPFAAAWLHRAAVHTALNAIRGKQRRQRREATQSDEHARLHPEADASLDPQVALELGEQRRELRAALQRLPAKSAAVLALRYSGLGYAEVANALGVNINQVGTLLRRAEGALRKEVERGTSR
jgi:RNA polymerase sigma-70 factor (ECF subfamily)